MQLVKEIEMPDGSIQRQIIKQDKTSFEQTGDFLDDMNQGIGYSLSPFSFQGGFSISTTWLIFFFCCFLPLEAAPWMGAVWLLSLFVRFR